MNELAFAQFVTYIPFYEYLPAPDRFYTSAAGSLAGAALLGAATGLAGRVIYPTSGISPLHYSIWFSIAFEIKYGYDCVKAYLEQLLKKGPSLKGTEDEELGWGDCLRRHYWRLIARKDSSLEAVDGVVSRLLNIRPYTEIHAENVANASFIEMCRYRVWRVFKATIIDTICFALAYRLTHRIGFSLPGRTSVPLFIVLRSLVRDILLIPSLHLYARFCSELAEDEKYQERAQWLRSILPAL